MPRGRPLAGPLPFHPRGRRFALLFRRRRIPKPFPSASTETLLGAIIMLDSRMLIKLKGRARCLLLMVVLLNCDLRGAIAQNSAARPSASETEADSQGETLLLSNSIAVAEKSRWSFCFESIYTFDQIPNPWFIIFLHPHKKNFRDYKFATEILSARYRVTDTSVSAWKSRIKYRAHCDCYCKWA
jgi:hypothetical protein